MKQNVIVEATNFGGNFESDTWWSKTPSSGGWEDGFDFRNTILRDLLTAYRQYILKAEIELEALAYDFINEGRGRAWACMARRLTWFPLQST